MSDDEISLLRVALFAVKVIVQLLPIHFSSVLRILLTISENSTLHHGGTLTRTIAELCALNLHKYLV